MTSTFYSEAAGPSALLRFLVRGVQKPPPYQLPSALQARVGHVFLCWETLGQLQGLDSYQMFNHFQFCTHWRDILVNLRSVCFLSPKHLYYIFLPIWTSFCTFYSGNNMQFMRLLWIPTVFFMIFRWRPKSFIWNSWPREFVTNPICTNKRLHTFCCRLKSPWGPLNYWVQNPCLGCGGCSP